MGADPVVMKPQMVNVTAQAKLHNSLLPIHCLATEVVIEIFLQCTDINSESLIIPRYYYARIRNIALVSTTWAALVFETRALWSYLHWRQSRDDLLNSLTRSKRCPLVVEYDDQDWKPESVQEEERLVSFVDSAYREIHRWRAAYLLVDGRARASKLLFSYLNVCSAPLLKELMVCCSPETPPSQSINPFSLGAEHLQLLTLEDVLVRWDSP